MAVIIDPADLYINSGLSVHRTSDGSCLASTIVETKPKSAVGGKAQPTPSVLWVWRKLLVAASEEVRLSALGDHRPLISPPSACICITVNHPICLRIPRRVLSYESIYGH